MCAPSFKQDTGSQRKEPFKGTIQINEANVVFYLLQTTLLKDNKPREDRALSLCVQTGRRSGRHVDV